MAPRAEDENGCAGQHLADRKTGVELLVPGARSRANCPTERPQLARPACRKHRGTLIRPRACAASPPSDSVNPDPFHPVCKPPLFFETVGVADSLRRLEEGVGAREPFLLLTGESGTGKTTLANA